MGIHHLCPACGALQTTRGRCPDCATPRTQTLSTRAREARYPQRAGYRTTAYRNARRVALYRDEVCQACGSGMDLTVHHIDGNTRNNDPDNLEALCRRCHARHHGQPPND